MRCVEKLYYYRWGRRCRKKLIYLIVKSAIFNIGNYDRYCKITVQCGNNAIDCAKKAIEKLNECLDNGFYQVAEYKNGELMITVSDPPVWVTQMKNEITDL